VEATLHPPVDAASTAATGPTEPEKKPQRHRETLTAACEIKDEDERASALTAICRRWQRAVQHLFPVWAECGGMTYADQWGEYNQKTGLWQGRTQVPEKKITRIELNHMEPICSDIAAIQTQDPPNMRATAPTDSSAAASATQTADQLVWWMWEQGNYDTLNRQLREAACVYGEWYLFPRWDPTGGRLVETVTGVEPVAGPPDPATGLPTSMGLREVKKLVREGTPDDALVSCFDGIPDPSAKAEYDGEGFVLHERMSVARADELYPDHAGEFEIVSAASGTDGLHYTQRLHNASPRAGGIFAKDDQAAQEVDVWTIFVRTSSAFYRGKWIVIVGSTIVYDEDNPVYPTAKEEAKGEGFPNYHWPVWRIGHKAVAGSYHCQGAAVRMIGPQKKLNGVASKKLHMLKRTSHPTLVKPARANFVKTDEPDQQINVPPDIQPGSIYYLNSPGVPAELQMEERLSVEQMERIGGLNAGSRGSSNADDSGRKVALLQQRDFGRLASVKLTIDRQIGQAFSYKLRLWRRYATVARTLVVVGENNATSARQFDMASIAPGTDIIVFSDAALPRGPEARMLHVEKAVQLKIVDPADPMQRAALAEVIGLAGQFRKWQSSLYADKKCAENENLRMYDGEPQAVEFWYDDLQHLSEHYTEMNTEAWQRATTPLPGDPPEVAMKKQRVRAIYLAHVQEHQRARAVKMSGGMPGAPGPGQPGAPPNPMMPSPQGGPSGQAAPPMPMAGPQSPQAGPPGQRVAA
jgi:hypothetical protein